MADQMDNEADAIDLRKYLSVVGRHKALIAITAVVAVVIAVGFSAMQDKVYQASTEVLLQSSPSEDVLNGNPQQNPQFLQQLVQTEIEVMQSRSITDAVEEQLGYDPNVSIAAKGQTQVVTIRAQDPSPEQAAEEADTYADVYVQTRRDSVIADLNDAVVQLQTQADALDSSLDAQEAIVTDLQAQIDAAPEDQRAALTAQRDAAQAELDALRTSAASRRVALQEQIDELQTTATLTQTRGAEIVSEARLPTQPISPNPRRDGVLALFLGLVIGLGLAFLKDHLDDSIRSKDTLEQVTGGLPTLALVPVVGGWKSGDEPMVESIEHPNSIVAEAYRGLRASIQFIDFTRQVRIIQVTSSSASEGKSATSSNLAVALARAGKRVVLVDCDLRLSRTHKFFKTPNQVGFTSVLLRDVPLAEALVPVEGVPGLRILPAGPPPPNPSELLGTRATKGLLAALAENVDYVIIDSTPLLPVSDSVVLAAHVDAVIMVASAGSTTKTSLTRSLEMLRLVDAPLVGVVLNRAQDGSAYGYQSGYGTIEEPAAPAVAAADGASARRRPRADEAPSVR
jgi:receptor protein-tyrosine kinase